ncbi:hypothetical protein MSPP1_003490 [Malassezia sp. CBS 17886]|nr:hypothetical protein MSPP1_003490 [Malassezia sp. CBS 17886]
MEPSPDEPGADSLLTEIHSLAPYFPYDQGPKQPAHAQPEETPAHTHSRRTKRRDSVLAEANDHVVVDRQRLRMPPYLAPSERVVPASNVLPLARNAGRSVVANPLDSVVMPFESARIREDIVRIVVQWLDDEGFGASRQALLDEAGINLRVQEDKLAEQRKMRSYLLEGNWPEIDKLCTKPQFKDNKALLYVIFKQQYLEHIEHREFQKAFTFLIKRLKPLENYQPHAGEFGDLCYLLSAKSVTDAPSFRSWEGIQPAREALVTEFAPVLGEERVDRTAPLPWENGRESDRADYEYVPPHRLLSLLHQAAAYQVEFARYQRRTAPVVSTLLHDYTGFIVPDRCRSVLRGHQQNVKCVRFVGTEGRMVASGSSDCTVRLWDTATGDCSAVLDGHGSRVWDVDSTLSGAFVASASGDSTVKLWNTGSHTLQLTLAGGFGDVYCCRFSPDQDHLVTGGYDKLVRQYDLATGAVVRMFPGHQLGVSSAVFSPQGNLIASGAKDTSVRLWDTLSGLCVRALPGHLGEVTSVEMSDDGLQLLTSSKDNAHRLWDMRTLRLLQRFKGHQNTSKNFIRSAFANPSLIVSGSEDGLVYMWDHDSTDALQTLEGHGVEPSYVDGAIAGSTEATALHNAYFRREQATVYSTVWNSVQGMLASCSDDGTVRLWDWMPPGTDEDRSVL